MVAFSPQAASPRTRTSAGTIFMPANLQVTRLFCGRRDHGILLAAARQRGGDEAVRLLLLDELAQVLGAALAVLLRHHRLLDDHEAPIEHAVAGIRLRPFDERGLDP